MLSSLSGKVFLKIPTDVLKKAAKTLQSFPAFGQGLAVRGKHWIRMSTKADADSNHRLSAESKFMDTLLTFVPTKLSFAQWKSKYSMKYSSVMELPPNVHLLTLEEWAGNSRDSVLLRLEHQVCGSSSTPCEL